MEQHDMEQIRERLTTLEALLKCIDRRYEVLEILAECATVDDAVAKFVDWLEVGAVAATAILDMPFRRVISAERIKLAAELEELSLLLSQGE